MIELTSASVSLGKDTKMGRERQSFTAAEKLKVIKYAEIHGNRAASREFNIGESNIPAWQLTKKRYY